MAQLIQIDMVNDGRSPYFKAQKDSDCGSTSYFNLKVIIKLFI